VNQTALQRGNHRLSSIVNVQALQDGTDVAFHRGLGNSEDTGDLLVAISTYQQMKDFFFTSA
jgi:hypothetical protein